MALITWLFFASLLSLASSGARPRPLVWSSQTYGPDRPWQAVKIQVGTPPQPNDLYPGRAWESLILGKEYGLPFLEARQLCIMDLCLRTQGLALTVL
jgi:hypothetical protein